MLELGGGILELLLTAMVYAAIARVFPKREPAEDETAMSPARKDRLAKIYGWGNLAVLALAVPCGLVIFQGMVRGARWWHGGPEVEYVLIPGFVFWLLPTMLLAILAAGILVDITVRWKLGSEYRDFEAVVGEQLGFDATRGGLLVGGVCLLICAGLGGMFLRWHLALTPNEMRMGWPVYESRVVPYSQVQTIREIQKGVYPVGGKKRVVEQPHFRIVFGPGEDDFWRSKDLHPDEIPEEVRAAMAYVAKKSGKPIEISVTGR